MPPSKKIAPPKAVVRSYASYLKRYPWYVFGVFALGGAVQAAALVGPLYLRQFFNILGGGHPGPATAHALALALAIVASMWLVDWAARRSQDIVNIYLGAKIMDKLYLDAFEYLLGHSYSFFANNFVGTLTSKVGKYARAFETIFDTIVMQFYPTIIFVGGATFVLWQRNALLGLGLFGWSIAFVAFQFWIAKLRQPSRNARAEADTRITGTLADAIGNQATVQQFAGAGHEAGIFESVVGAWRTATLKSWMVDSITWGGISLFVIAIQAALLWAGIYLWEQGRLTIGDFVLIQSYLFSVFSQLTGMGFQLRRFYDSFADAGEMVAILEQPHEVVDAPGAVPLTVAAGRIDFSGVQFFFERKSPVLHDFNLILEGGQKVALVGPSGAGKSTVTKLLLRLYDVPAGRISIDGQDIAQITQESLREAIAFVPQEPILFHRTLLENIRYGRRDATDEEVRAAARAAHCEFIERLPDGFNTYVGERGIKLSGGERQRVAIARAVLKNAPILVLDEATSALDSESESLIQDALSNLMRGKTVLVIAHRLSTIMKMDRIIVLEQGRVVADGTHDELLKQGGLYHKLWSIQAGGFITDDLKTVEETE